MNKRGFTIIELLVTISVISLLIAAASVGVVRARKNGRDAQRIGDIVGIANAIDQSVTLNRGKFPYNPISQNQGTMCAHDLVTGALNPNNLDLSLFRNRTISKDPLPAIPLVSNCASYLNGYTYHNRAGGANPILKSATDSNYEYALEVGLENERPSDEEKLLPGGASGSNRIQYILHGGFCGTGAAAKCTTP